MASLGKGLKTQTQETKEAKWSATPGEDLKKYQKLRDTLNKSLQYLFFNIIFVPFLRDPNIPSKHIWTYKHT